MDDGWVKSSFCHQGGCVEVFRGPTGLTAVRNSGDLDQRLTLTTEEWDAFVKGVKAGEFDV